MELEKKQVIFGLLLTILISISFISLTTENAFAHSGRTDASGGHRDNKNASGLGSYHYHHGYPAHLHPNGICPYEAPVEIPVKIPVEIPVSSVSINSSYNTLSVGESIVLSADIYPYNATNTSVSWISSNKNVATVNSAGVVTAVGAGVVIISAQSNNGIKDSIYLTIIKPIERITIVQKNLSLFVGEKRTLTVNITPNDATTTDVFWSSTDPNIVEVNNAGEIVAKSVGVATITAKAHNGANDSIRIKVNQVEESIPVASVSFESNDFASIQRLAGQDRYETAVTIAKAGWQQADYAILAYGLNFPDSVAATPLAKKFDAPVLLTAKDKLTDVTKQALTDLKVKYVFIVGGESVITSNVEAQVNSMGIMTERIAGSDRYETAVRIAEKLGNVNSVVVCTGADYADALTVGPVAGNLGVPILLVPQNYLPMSVKNYLASKNVTSTIVVGNQAQISDSVLRQLPQVERISGADKYERNIAILNKYGSQFSLDSICFATGETFADALAGAAYAVKTNSRIILLPKDKQIPDINNYLKGISSKITKAIIFGGESAVSEQVINNN